MAQNYCVTPSAELSINPSRGMGTLTQRGAAVVQRLNPLVFPDWNERLPVHPERSFFHLAEWARVLHESYGYAPCYLTRGAGGRVDQVLPLMEVESRLSGRRGVGLPFTDFSPPLADEPGALRELWEEAINYGAARGWKYLELRGGRGLLTAPRAAESYYVHELSLEADTDKVAAGFKDSVRRAIRKAEKLGVTVASTEGVDGLREFYALQCRTRRRHGLPPQPLRFFLKIHEHILSRQKGLLLLARQGRKAVAGAVFLHDGKEAIFKYGASDAAHQALRGNDLVMWEAIRHYASQGFRSLHLGRTSLANMGLRRFKLAWGTREQVLEYVRYDLQQRAFVRGKDEAFGWYNRVFRLLPLNLSRWVGAVAYRHVA